MNNEIRVLEEYAIDIDDIIGVASARVGSDVWMCEYVGKENAEDAIKSLKDVLFARGLKVEDIEPMPIEEWQRGYHVSIVETNLDG